MSFKFQEYFPAVCSTRPHQEGREGAAVVGNICRHLLYIPSDHPRAAGITLRKRDKPSCRRHIYPPTLAQCHRKPNRSRLGVELRRTEEKRGALTHFPGISQIKHHPNCRPNERTNEFSRFAYRPLSTKSEAKIFVSALSLRECAMMAFIAQWWWVAFVTTHPLSCRCDL